MRRVLKLVPLFAWIAMGCGTAMPPDAPPDPELRLGTEVHKLPLRDLRPIAASAPAGAHLTYYGGRVVSNLQVVQVLYGTGSYLSQVSSTASPSMATFYQGVLNSAYVDWLDSDYNTVSPSGTKTNQHIGRGSFLRQVTITPSSANNGTTISDTQVQNELAAQIQSGALPAPSHDAAGNNNTYYAVFFPHGKTITQGGSNSCQAGGFCAYHGTVANVPNFGEIYYGVHPDMQAGSGCDTGCGSAATAFGNYTSVASHEMIETVTDAEVGIAPSLAPPLAWYDNTNGEIGDICNAQQGSIAGSDGVTYVVQKEFSNSSNDCIVSKSVTPTNDFSIAVSPSSQTVAAGSSVSYTVTTATTSGSAQTISFSVSGLPSGVTGSFSPTSVSSGQSSTLTLTAASTAPSATATFTVTGTAPSGSHTANASVTVSGSGGGGGGGAIVNGDFEAGSLTGWTATGASDSVISSGCHGGTYCARTGSTSPTNGDSSIAQTFTAPTGTTGLSFFYKMSCPDTVTYDWMTVTLKDNTAGTTATVIAKQCVTNSAWVQKTASVTAGHSYTLTLTSHDDNYTGDATYTLFDDVTLTSTPPPPPPPSGITNGGFETGTVSGWTTSGSVSITTVAHSGSYAALAGATTATNGDSSLVQTFSAPSGVTTLSLYYANNCPDTVTYDWVVVTLKDNTAGTTTTVVPKTCAASYTWTHATASVTAGHSYTLTLTSHDDNYSADPTYTLFDDVTLQ